MSEMSIEQAHAAPEAAHGHDAAEQAKHNENLKFAMWLYLGSEVVIFAVMIAMFILFRLHHPDVVQGVHHEASILLVSLNTFILLSSSWAMVMGLRALQRGNPNGLMQWL